MSFFSRGFACFHKRKATDHTARNGQAGDGDKTPEVEGELVTPTHSMMAYQDAYGRRYWRHSVTGEWLLYNGAAYFNAQQLQRWPTSPMTGFHPVAPWNAPPGIVLPVPPATPSPVYVVTPEEDATTAPKKKKSVAGFWDTVYAKDGSKHWRHTGTGKTTPIDPYV